MLWQTKLSLGFFQVLQGRPGGRVFSNRDIKRHFTGSILLLQPGCWRRLLQAFRRQLRLRGRRWLIIAPHDDRIWGRSGHSVTILGEFSRPFSFYVTYLEGRANGFLAWDASWLYEVLQGSIGLLLLCNVQQ